MNGAPVSAETAAAKPLREAVRSFFQPADMGHTNPFHWELRRELLECRLEVASLRGSFTQEQRLGWVAQRLSEYVDIWNGFANHDWGDPPTLTDLPGFPMIEIGAELFQRELGSVETRKNVEPAWRVFEAHLAAIQKNSAWDNSAGSMVENSTPDARSDRKHLPDLLFEAAQQLESTTKSP